MCYIRGWEGLEVFMGFWDNALPLINQREIKQADLVRLTGKAKSTVWNWFERKTVPQADDAVKIADLLGVSVRYLVTGEDDKELSAREKELLDVCSLMSDRKFSIVLKNAKAVREDMEQELSSGSSSGVSDKKIK